MSFNIKTNAVLAIFCSFLIVSCSTENKSTHVVGVLEYGGAAYTAGNSISDLFANNKIGDLKSSIKCSVEVNENYEQILRKIGSHKISMGIVRSDWIDIAYSGKQPFEKSANKKLKTLLTLYPEYFTVVARKSSKIKYFEDLKNKKVGVGYIGSSHRRILNQLIAEYRWGMKNFSRVSELELDEMRELLCKGEIDAFIILSAHPDNFMSQILETCDAQLVSVHGDEVDALLQKHSYYRLMTIDNSIYGERDIKTFGLDMALVTSNKMSDENAYIIVKSVFSKLRELRESNQVLSKLDKKDMASYFITSPHSGALRYFKEANILF